MSRKSKGRDSSSYSGSDEGVVMFFSDPSQPNAGLVLLTNILWLIFSFTWLTAVVGFLVSLLFSLTIVGMSSGKKVRDVVWLAFMPFGKQVGYDTSTITPTEMVFSILWFPVGLFLGLLHLFMGFFSALTIIGIPFAVEHFKVAGAWLFPMATNVMFANRVF